jgi:hypothetical protein
MGRVASSVDNTKIKSFSSTMQRDLLDTGTWDTPDQPGSAIFEWIEAWSRYAGDPLPDRWGPGAGVTSADRGSRWTSCRAWCEALDLVAVS